MSWKLVGHTNIYITGMHTLPCSTVMYYAVVFSSVFSNRDFMRFRWKATTNIDNVISPNFMVQSIDKCVMAINYVRNDNIEPVIFLSLHFLI